MNTSRGETLEQVLDDGWTEVEPGVYVRVERTAAVGSGWAPRVAEPLRPVGTDRSTPTAPV